MESINTPLKDYELFDDAPFWHLPDDVADAYKLKRDTNQPNTASFEMIMDNTKQEQFMGENGFNASKVFPK